MARVTVEDCIDKVPNRFELVLLAARRARAIASGAQIALDRDNDKNAVVALREIAEGAVSHEDIKEDLIHSHQAHVDVDEPEPELVPTRLPEPFVSAFGKAAGPDDEVPIDRITEDELLQSLKLTMPPESEIQKARKLRQAERRGIELKDL